MNFFEHQDRARRHTGRLVLLMALAVVSLIALTSLSLALIWHFYGEPESRRSLTPILSPSLVGAVAVVVIGVVLIGSLYKRVQLNAGGKVVAESLGGRLINLSPQDFYEKRLLNVVEEMALASGTPVPSVYVLEDDGINAFAAGLSPKDAVIGVTQGAMSLLDRDELQGVIAHEFSHIYNGDMRLNMRLIALLHGILLIGLIGSWVLRSDTGSSRRSSSSNDNKGELFKLAVGLTLLILGYAGTFFGNLIKAAVSRQREFLADASAVQFTRNPDSIGGALKKIGGHAAGSQLRAANAAEFSHLYFGAGIKSAIDGMFATHPPLAERIRRIEPGWDGQFPQVKRSKRNPEDLVAAPNSPARPGKAQEAFAGTAVAQSIAAIGDPGLAHLQEAQQTLRALPDALVQAAHDREGAQALVYGLLLDSVEVLQQQQLDLLRPHLQPALAERLEALRAPLREVPLGQRLALIDLAIPALKQLGKDEFAAVKRGMALLIRADDRVDLLEWTLLRIVERNVEGLRSVAGKYRLESLAEDVSVLLSYLARAGHSDLKRAGQAFAYGCAELAFVVPAFRHEGDLKALEAALHRLTGLLPLQKPQLLKAMARCMGHDGQITATEAELMRAVADILDCPMPPLLTENRS